MFIIPKRQTGFTLIELLIGMLLGLIVAAGAIGLFVIGLQGQNNNINLARLNQDLRATMDIMARDIRRAGFVTTDISNVTNLKNNPFFRMTSGASTDLMVYSDFATGTCTCTCSSGSCSGSYTCNGIGATCTTGQPTYTGSCIVYSYNQDDADPSTPSNNERFGFRLSNGEIQMRRNTTDTPATTNENCSNTNGSWESVTEPNIEITNLAFTLSTSTLNVTSMQDPVTGDGNNNGLCDIGETCNTCSNTGASGDPACLYIRTVNISLTGRLRNDTSIIQTITEQVRIRNDKFLDEVP